MLFTIEYQGSEQVIGLYKKLVEEINQLQPTTPGPETPLSPDPTNLLGVPTPAAL